MLHHHLIVDHQSDEDVRQPQPHPTDHVSAPLGTTVFKSDVPHFMSLEYMKLIDYARYRHMGIDAR